MGGSESWRDAGTREGMNDSGRKRVRAEGRSEEVWEGGAVGGSLLRVSLKGCSQVEGKGSLKRGNVGVSEEVEAGLLRGSVFRNKFSELLVGIL